MFPEKERPTELKSMESSFPLMALYQHPQGCVLSSLKSILKNHVYYLTVHNNLILSPLRLIPQLPGFQFNSMDTN